MTNAVRYGSEPGDRFKVTAAAESGKCRVEVHDIRRRRPRLRPPSDQRVRGRGLHLVEALASRWGVAERPFGKSVWVVVTWRPEPEPESEQGAGEGGRVCQCRNAEHPLDRVSADQGGVRSGSGGI
ncbi:ATP-binding protein [Streptomyces sp. NPDC007346]|uniref:ATP-binding protein n=1 Tax=Streptomyces sp. NPDC007346 TaxID=3154682 RepID=UPI0034559D3C